jgi:ATP synthase protein I
MGPPATGFSPPVSVECQILSSYNARRLFHDAVPVGQQDTSKPDAVPTRRTAPGSQYLRTTLIQLVVTAWIAALAYVLSGTHAMKSLVSGALCALVPQAYFGLRMTVAARHSAQRAARLGLAAEGGKFLLSAAAFALVFAVLKPTRPGLVFLGFGVLWAVQVAEGIRLLGASGKGPTR